MHFLSNAPVLIPIAGQHYMAAEPSDMIVAGCDLADYLAGGPRSAATKGAARHIRFWSDVLYTHWSGWLDVLRRGARASRSRTARAVVVADPLAEAHSMAQRVESISGDEVVRVDVVRGLRGELFLV